ncbi:beta-glucosidase family protein [Streptomyces boninensis]|uniref:beta-glucosidase family protein n=1 Tax=Streptomyces boninensis TaxID=2039455 RepID=UPI003B2218B4
MSRPQPTRRNAIRLAGAIAVAAAATPVLPAAGASATGTGGGRSVSANRIQHLLADLTLDEKISLLHGHTDPDSLGQAGYIPGVPRLGIPAIRLTDGPAGVRVTAHATALPAPILLAAAFSPELARAYGKVIGHEGRALGQDVLLSPMVNLIRTPYAGRNFETFSEDPLLSGDLVAAEIEGIQGEHMIATVKHFALNNQEHERNTIDVHAAEQTKQEMELRPFAAAIAAGSGAVMGSYNRVDGTFACENKSLLTDVLREQWGFDGWVMTDWYAAHSTAQAIAAGLDMEMPDDKYFGPALKKAVQDGTVAERLVDRAAGRILAVLDRFGLLDGSIPARPKRDAAAGAETAHKIAVAGATLLRNERHTLPLAGPAARSLAVIGPTGELPFVSGGGSAHVIPDRADSPLDVLKKRARTVTYALGDDIFGKAIPRTALSPAADLDHTGAAAIPAGKPFSYEGRLTVASDDEWTFVIQFSGAAADRPKVRLDGKELFPQAPGFGEYFSGGVVSTTPDGLSVRRTAVKVSAGSHALRITADGGKEGQQFRLTRITSDTQAADVAEAVAAARKAATAVVFAYEDATEGKDRTTIALPGNQDALIRAVTRANPNTIVVLNTSSAVAMPWLRDTAAVLQMYYPGQEGARATADVLYGDANPGGRLTQSYPASDDVHATAGDARRYPGVDGVEEYSEGIHLGYRWFDKMGRRPLFPFGYGLSYTSFAYSRLRVEAAADGGLEVSFTVRNTGRRAGADVPQVYVGPSPELRLDQAVRSLAGYRRVELEPGRSERVTVRISASTLSSWSEKKHGWVLGTGRREVWVGASARDLRLHGRAEVGRRD